MIHQQDQILAGLLSLSRDKSLPECERIVARALANLSRDVLAGHEWNLNPYEVFVVGRDFVNRFTEKHNEQAR